MAAAQNGPPPSSRDAWAGAAERLSVAAAASSSRRLRSATGRNLPPRSVSVTLRVVRSNRRKPSWVSSSRTSKLIPDCVMKSCSAAREKLWCRAVSTKALSCREVIFIANGDESLYWGWYSPRDQSYLAQKKPGDVSLRRGGVPRKQKPDAASQYHRRPVESIHEHWSSIQRRRFT